LKNKNVKLEIQVIGHLLLKEFLLYYCKGRRCGLYFLGISFLQERH